jgi:hypothetical protein
MPVVGEGQVEATEHPESGVGHEDINPRRFASADRRLEIAIPGHVAHQGDTRRPRV